MRIRIIGKLPKAQFGGECPNGYIKDPSGNCVPELKANSPSNYNWTNFNEVSTPKRATVPQQDSLGDITVGNMSYMTNDPFANPSDYPRSFKSEEFDPQKDFREDNAAFELAYKNGNRKQRKNYMDYYNNKYGTDYKNPLFGPKAEQTINNVAGFTKLGLSLGSAAVDMYNNKQTQKDWNKYFRDQNMNPANTGPTYRGDYDVNNGMFRPNELGFKSKGMYAEYGGENTNEEDMKKIRIRISGGPQEMAYGGQSGYGLDLGQRKIFYEMPKTKSEIVKNTIQEVPREEANIEAEAGETVYGDIDADGGLEHLKIGGKRHVDGGTPLNVPEGSFIYSDTKKMKIKDPEVLAHFGKKSYSNGGTTPAELAKQYNINKYKSIIEDPYADPISKTTAQLMVKNYEKKLGQLAIVQESMKDFPGGVPEVAKKVIPEQAAMVEQAIMQQQMGEENPELNTDEYTEQEEEQYAYGGNLKEYQGAVGSSTISPKMQELQKKYPWLQPWLKSKTKAGGISRTTNVPTTYDPSNDENIYGDINYWMDMAKQTGQPINSIEDLQRFSYNTINKSNPDAVTQMWKGYGPTAASNKQDVDNFANGYMGRRTAQMLGERPKDPTNQYWICGANGPVEITEQQAAGYDNGSVFFSKDMAEVNCQTTPQKEIPPGKTENNYTPPNPFNPPSVPDIPFGYLQPDVFNMAATAAVAPRKFLPYIPNPTYTPGNVVFEDWRGKAAARQSQYNTSANTLGTYQPSTGLASNLAFLAGQNAEGLGQDIANVDARNVATANTFGAQEQQRADQYNLINTNNAIERWKGNVIANQQYDNSMRKYIADNSKSFANAWNNRMKLAMMNATNPLYNVMPSTGNVKFMPGVSRESIVNKNNYGTNGYTWDQYPLLVNYLSKMKVPQDKIHDTASKIILGGVKNTNSMPASFRYNMETDDDEEGYPY
jgi:hypothetical protein